MVTGPAVCPACGAKVRADRARCLRCGASLGAGEERPRAVAVQWATAGAVIACVALGGFAFAVSHPGEAHATVPIVTAPQPQRTTGVAEATPMEPRAQTATAGAFAARQESAVGIAAYKDGDVAAAIERFTKAVDANPQDAASLNNLGQALVRAGRAADAVPYFDRAIAAADTVWAYHFNRARAYSELREWPRAIDGYRRAAELFPTDYATQYNLAKALQESGDVNAALPVYERAIALAPGAAGFQLSYAAALETANRTRDAAAAYRRYLTLEPATADRETITARIADLDKR